MAKKLYVRGMEVKRPKDHEGYFFGEHPTGYGNIWDAVFGVSEKLFVYLRMIMEKGDVVFKNLKTKKQSICRNKVSRNQQFFNLKFN